MYLKRLGRDGVATMGLRADAYADASLPHTISCHPPPGAATCNLEMRSYN